MEENSEKKIKETEYLEDKYTLVNCEFFFYQAEKMLETTIQVSDSFQNRSVRFLSIYIPIVIAIFAYIVTHPTLYHHTIALGFVLVGLIIACLRYCVILKAKKAKRVGSLPSDLVDPMWHEFEGDTQKKAVLLSECKDYEKRIESRMRQNDEAGRQFNNALRDLLIFGSIGVISYILYFILPSLLLNLYQFFW